jgi:outer membrane protein assembly factor BamA
VQLGYIYPWFSIPDLTFRPTVSRSETQYIILDAQTTSAALSWEYPLIKKWNVTGLFTYSLEGIKQFNSKDKVDNQEIRIGTVSPSVRIDQRDSALTPTRGWYASGSFELAAPWLLSQSDPFPIGYYRFQVRGDKYVPLPMGMTWYFSARTGVERSNEGPVEGIDPSGAIPFIKEFALGGASSLRGFKEQELNLESRLIRGLAAYWNYRTQLDFPFSGALRIGPFVDAANLTVDRISPVEDLRFGAGVGLHYQSPVGPVNLDWGFKWKPRPNEDRFRFYFSIGVI